MKKIIAIGGSNSKKSINKMLATYAASQIENSEISVLDLNDLSLPIYGIDLELESGIPEDVIKLNNLLKEADGLVISLAEHNGTFSVSFKNVIDWLSRIDKDVWKNKPMLLMATSPGSRGGMRVLKAAKEIFPRLGGNIVADFSLPLFKDNFSENGLKDKVLNTELNQKIAVLQKAIG